MTIIEGTSGVGTWFEEHRGVVTPKLPYTHEQSGDMQRVQLGLVPDISSLDAGELGDVVASFTFRTIPYGFEPDGVEVTGKYLWVYATNVPFRDTALCDRLEAVAQQISSRFFNESAWRSHMEKDFTKADFRARDWAEEVD